MPMPPARRGGQAIVIALVVLLLLGALATGFFQVMRHTQHAAGIFSEDNLLRRVVEAGANEAARRIRLAAGQTTAEARGLIAWFSGPPGSDFELTLPLAEAWGNGLVKRGESLRLSCRLTQLDVREGDSRGNRYYPGEKVGTLGLTVQGSIRGSDGQARRVCTFTRHHDLKVAAVTTPLPAGGRTGYADFFPLDYALLVRNGLEEFGRTDGQSVNPPRQRLVIEQPEGADPGRLGKVFFGGTGRDRVPVPPGCGDEVFVNVPPEGQGLIPVLPSTEVRRIDLETCVRLFPALEPGRGGLAGLEGVFTAVTAPIPPVAGEPADDREAVLRTIRNGLAAGSIGPQRNILPGLALIGPWQTPLAPGLVEQCLEGRLRQRFLYAVTFHLDLSKVGRVDPALAEQVKAWSRRIPCLSPEMIGGIAGLPPEYQAFAEGVKNLEGRAGGGFSLFSRFQSDYLLVGGLSGTAAPPTPSFPQPVFFSVAGARIPESRTGWGDGFCPFRHFNLLTHRFETFEELETYGLLDRPTGELRLAGAVTIPQKTPVVLDRLTIHGQGALLASGFRIRGGLRKAGPGDIGILVALDGQITVDTDEPVEAALIAVNHTRSGRVVPGRPLTVHGALCVDELGTWRWPVEGVHRIRYDRAFRVETPVFQPFLSPWISFQKQVFER